MCVLEKIPRNFRSPTCNDGTLQSVDTPNVYLCEKYLRLEFRGYHLKRNHRSFSLSYTVNGDLPNNVQTHQSARPRAKNHRQC